MFFDFGTTRSACPPQPWRRWVPCSPCSPAARFFLIFRYQSLDSPSVTACPPWQLTRHSSLVTRHFFTGHTSRLVRCLDLTPLFATLTKTPGVYPNSSQFGTRHCYSLLPYFVASLLPSPSFLSSHGVITSRKITGSGHTFTCRPRCPPCGLIQASFGTSPLFKIK